MTPTEKRNILILMVVSIIFIICLQIFAKSRASEEGNMLASAGTEQEVTEPENEIEEYVQILQDGSKLNISDEIAKTKTVDGYEITNIQLKEKEQGTMTTLLADVENKTNQKTKDQMIKVEILDKAGNVITTTIGFIDPLEAGEKGEINVSITADVSNAYDIRISKI